MSEELKQKKIKSPAEALSALMRLCSRGERSSGDAMRLMHRWGVDAGARAGVLARLKELKFIDDERFAEAYVRDRIHFGGWGYYKIKAGLKAKGIDSDVINRILLSAESDGRTVERLSEMMERKNRSLSVSSPGQAKAKLIRFGLSRGFDFETVRAAVEKTLGTEDECD